MNKHSFLLKMHEENNGQCSEKNEIKKVLGKAIARHSLTGVNIIISHDGLFNISYCHYNQSEKLENNYKTSF